MKTIDIGFLGGIYPSNDKGLLANSKSGLDYAADVYQKRYLKAICESLNSFGDIEIFFSVFNCIFIGSWPINYKKIVVRESVSYNTIPVKNIPFFNVVGLRELSRKKGIINAVFDWYNKGKSHSKILFVYSHNFSYIYQSIKKLCPHILICTILLDLPKFTFLNNKKTLRRLLVKHRDKIFQKSCKYVDYHICITQAMAEYVRTLSSANCKFKIIEGIGDRDRCINNIYRLETQHLNNSSLIIFYSGGLEKEYGINNLLDAFHSLDNENIELRIVGEGKAKKSVIDAATLDKRIVYYGQLTNQTVKKMQEDADILVNPRMPNQTFVNYSFPSKILEYLESGNLVVSYKLPGIPREYYDHFICPTGLDSAGLKNALLHAISLSHQERIKSGLDNLHFLLENKCEKQIRSIINELMDSN